MIDDLRPREPARRTGLRSGADRVLVDVAARTGVSPRAVVSLLLLAVLVLAVIGVRSALTRVGAEPTPIPALAAVTTSGPAPSSSVAATVAPMPTATATTTATAGQLVVHVVGQVRRAGVVRLPAGSRVEDALRAAGGARQAADLTAVNLARPLVDGEQVALPKRGEPAAAAPAPTGAAATGPGSAMGAGSPVDLNTATEEQLDALPGVGPVLAGRILDWRAQHGRFSSVDELGEVSGIGEKVLERLRPLVRV